MEKILILLSLQRQALEAETQSAFAHIIVNRTLQIVPYQQAVFWVMSGNKITLDKASGNVVIDDKTAHADDIRKTIESLINRNAPEIVKTAQEQKHIVIAPLTTPQDGLMGGLWLENDKEYQEADIQILQELSVSYAHALSLLSLRKRFGFFSSVKSVFRHRRYLVIAALVLFFLPVRQTITAPAEIVARDASIITIPHDGMVEKFMVQPGDSVTEGQIVAIMESTTLKAKADMANKELEVAEISLARLQREALADPNKKTELTVLESRIAEKRIEANYATEMQKNSEIEAPRAGTAIFSDVNKLQGKPAQMGAPLMQIANPDNPELLVRIPVQSMVPINKEARVEVYLNASPLFGKDADIRSIGYQASPDSDGLLTYKLRADFRDKDGLRIGWQGTAKIKGQWTILSYTILRRPIMAFRHLTGL